MAENQPATEPVAQPGAPSSSPTNGLAIAALVVGIIAILSGWAPFFGVLAGAAAIVLGILALKKSKTLKGMSIAGIITGAIGAIWSLIITVLLIVGFATLGLAGAAVSEAAREAQDALNEYNADAQAQIDAKKDYSQGQTARFGQFEVKVNSIERNYVNEDSFFGTPSEGKEFIVVNLTAKNVGTKSHYLSGSEIRISEDGVTNGPALIDVDPAFESGDVDPGASITGNIVYEVKKDADNLKLTYETYVYDSKGSGLKELRYTLAI